MHVAPHPDDEIVGAGATLLSLADAGWDVLNVACGLGRPEQRERRGRELAEACRRAGFRLQVLEGDLAAVLDAEDPAIVVSPSPHDGHHAHEAVGRSVRRAIEATGPRRWWMWGLWADLPLPTLACGFDERLLDRVLHALDAHAGEVRRSDYRRLVRGRAEMNAVLGGERIFGFGGPQLDAPYAELLCEALWDGRAWRLGAARTLDVDEPLAAGAAGERLEWWLDAPSLAARRAASRQR